MKKVKGFLMFTLLLMVLMGISVQAGSVTEQGVLMEDGVWMFTLSNPDDTTLVWDNSADVYVKNYGWRINKIVIQEGFTELEGWLASYGGWENLEEIVIAESVTKITNSFNNLEKLTTAKMPGVKEISYSFYRCPALANVSMPKTEKVKAASFSEAAITDVELPLAEEVNGFCDLPNLTRVNLPKAAVIQSAFTKCPKLNSVSISAATEVLSSFNDCPSIAAITLPEAKQIQYSFVRCTGLEEVSVPKIDSLQQKSFTGTIFAKKNSNMLVNNGELFVLDAESFQGEVKIPEGVTILSSGGNFGGNQNITKVVFPNTFETFDNENVTAYFAECSSLTEVVFPKTYDPSKTDISWIFQGTPWLTEQEKQGFIIINGTLVCCMLTDEVVTIPNGVTKIGNSAFCNDNCTGNLKEVIIPSGITRIGEMAFAECRYLKAPELPNTLKEIGAGAFIGHAADSPVSSIYSIEIPASVTMIGEHAFGYTAYKYGEIELPRSGFTVKGVTGSAAEKYAKENNFKFEAIDKTQDSNCNNTETPSTEKPSDTTGTTPAKGEKVDVNKATYKVTKAGSKNATVEYVAPTGTSSASITIPETVKINDVTCKVTSVAANAFKGNKKLKKVVIGKNVTSIGANAFSGCTKLTTVTIGKNVKTIGKKAFYNCTAIKKITIPAKVTKIGVQAFQGAKKLSNIVIKTTKLTKAKVGKNAFKGVKATATVKVPKAKKKAYKTILKARGITKVKMK